MHAFNHWPYFKMTCQLLTWWNRRNFADKPDRSKRWKFLKSIRKKPIRRRWFTRHNKISINVAKKKISVKDPLLISYNQMRRSRLEDFRRAFFASNQLNAALGKWRTNCYGGKLFIGNLPATSRRGCSSRCTKPIFLHHCITASLGNFLILISFCKVSSIFPPTKLMFRCLAFTDLCVGLISQPLFVYNLLSHESYFNFSVSVVIQMTSMCFLCGLSLLTATAISVDRLLALYLGLRYRQVVTLRRVQATLVSFLFFNFAFLGSVFVIDRVPKSIYLAMMLVSLVISAFSYIKIYIRLRYQLLHVQGHVQQHPATNGFVATALNLARYKRTVSTIAWVQLGLFACYLPFSVYFMMFIKEPAVIPEMFEYTVLSLVYLNSSLNPILYCWKIRDVKQAMKDAIRQLCSCREPNWTRALSTGKKWLSVRIPTKLAGQNFVAPSHLLQNTLRCPLLSHIY